MLPELVWFGGKADGSNLLEIRVTDSGIQALSLQSVSAPPSGGWNVHGALGRPAQPV